MAMIVIQLINAGNKGLSFVLKALIDNQASVPDTINPE